MGAIEVDLAVIGFGKGGKTLVGALAKAGKRVMLIEQSDQMYGGTCINTGCVPTKAMIFQTEHPDPRVDAATWFQQAAEKKTTLVEAMRAKNFQLFDSPETSTVITGRARFVDPYTLVVAAGGDQLTVKAATIVINTGSVSRLPPIPGLADSKRVVTSTGLLALTERPRELVILGGGYVGVEFASMYAAFGAKVTVIQRGAQLLPAEDPDIAAEVQALLTAAGVTVRTDATAEAVTDDGDRAVVTYRAADGASRTAAGELVLAALGRRPMTDGLGLAEVGIEVGRRGEVVVDEHLRTTLPHVYAVGDVNGGPQFTYVSLDDFRIVRDQLTGAGERSIADRAFVPHVVFTTPPLARVGMTEAEARATGRPLKTAVRKVAEMATVPRAKIVGDARGVMKAIVDAETDEVLGVALLAHDAHETVNTLAVALRLGATGSVLRDGIYTHPSMTEAFNDLFGNLA
ncbi:FAD-dependent oxidoreductase [Streptomyces sp. NPDC002734]|uniref:FAD-dependent oxidoreductase n=1 Tax=Streptomyces sp. NPDC002734 TaxID=3154426 RepID=UPI0033337144